MGQQCPLGTALGWEGTHTHGHTPLLNPRTAHIQRLIKGPALFAQGPVGKGHLPTPLRAGWGSHWDGLLVPSPSARSCLCHCPPVGWSQEHAPMKGLHANLQPGACCPCPTRPASWTDARVIGGQIKASISLCCHGAVYCYTTTQRNYFPASMSLNSLYISF